MAEMILHSHGLLSKWGFDDGRPPDTVLDAFDAAGIDYNRDTWERTLCRLVRKHLLPALDQRVQVEEIGTSHNPIRATAIAGVHVSDDVHYAREEWSGPDLTPSWVVVSVDEVLRVYRQEVDRG